MPFYGFSCEKCGNTELVFRHMADAAKGHEPSCEGAGELAHEALPMERNYQVESRNHVPGGMWPRVMKDFTGKPEVITSAAHHAQRARETGKTVRDDEAWIEQEVAWGRRPDGSIGQVMVEGSGRGTPRSWDAIPPWMSDPEEVAKFYKDRK